MKVTFDRVNPSSVVPSTTAEPPFWTLPMVCGTASSPASQQMVALAQARLDSWGNGTSGGSERICPPRRRELVRLGRAAGRDRDQPRARADVRPDVEHRPDRR